MDLDCAYRRGWRPVSQVPGVVLGEVTYCRFPLCGVRFESSKFSSASLLEGEDSQLLITEGRKRLSPWNDMFSRTKHSVQEVVWAYPTKFRLALAPSTSNLSVSERSTHHQVERPQHQLEGSLLLLPLALDNLLRVDALHSEFPFFLIQNSGFAWVFWDDEEKDQSEYRRNETCCRLTPRIQPMVSSTPSKPKTPKADEPSTRNIYSSPPSLSARDSILLFF